MCFGIGITKFGVEKWQFGEESSEYSNHTPLDLLVSYENI